MKEIRRETDPILDTPAAFRPAKGRPHIAALLSRPAEEREFAVIAYQDRPKHRAGGAA